MPSFPFSPSFPFWPFAPSLPSAPFIPSFPSVPTALPRLRTVPSERVISSSPFSEKDAAFNDAVSRLAISARADAHSSSVPVYPPSLAISYADFPSRDAIHSCTEPSKPFCTASSYAERPLVISACSISPLFMLYIKRAEPEAIPPISRSTRIIAVTLNSIPLFFCPALLPFSFI